ncbi:MAG TPA: hypothetical protein VFZ43_01500 [Anaerolineales bacterium]
MRSSWHYYVLLVLIVEKIVQHVVVTLAFYFNWADIASTVAISPTLLMVAGAIVTILFVLSLWGMVRKHSWALILVVVLALFDMVGEPVAQGRIAIAINVSFIVATVLLILAMVYRRSTG